MGIIGSLKALYRKSMISGIVSHLDSDTSITGTQLTRQVNILDAMHMLKVAVSDVKQESGTNCFTKAGFVTNHSSQRGGSGSPPMGCHQVNFKHILTLMCHLNTMVSLQRRISVHRSCRKNDSRETSQQDSDDDQDDHTLASCSAALTPKRVEAMQAMHTIRHFLEKSGADMQQFYALENQMMQLIATTSTQTSIRDFFTLPSPEY